LSRDIVERRCDVKRGELGCLIPCSLCSSCSLCVPSPIVSGSPVAGSVILGTDGESEVLSGAWLLAEDDRRLVRDLVPSADLSRAPWTAAVLVVSLASSKVSYQNTIVSIMLCGFGLHVRARCRVTEGPGRQDV
jgi:hypothetical protein